jgi:hypothetical protein
MITTHPSPEGSAIAAGSLRGRDHALAFRERNRDRLFNKHMFTGHSRRLNMFGMHLVRCCDVNDVDGLIRTQLIDGRVGRPTEFAHEARACIRVWISGCDETNASIGHERRQHEHEGSPKADSANAQRPILHQVSSTGLT